MSRLSIMSADCSNASLLDIFKKMRTVDLGKIALDNTTVKNYLTKEQDKIYRQYAVAGAMSKLNKTEDYFCIRDISPGFDFTDGCDIPIMSNQWMQTINIIKPSSTAMSIYRTSSKTKMYCKCMVIYGLEYSPRSTAVDEIQFWRTGTKLISRYALDHNNKKFDRMIFSTPMIWGLENGNDRFEVKFTFIKGARVTKIKLLGYVAETLGIPVI